MKPDGPSQIPLTCAPSSIFMGFEFAGYAHALFLRLLGAMPGARCARVSKKMRLSPMSIHPEEIPLTGFHVIQLHTDGAPILLFSAPTDLPQLAPKDLCVAGRLGHIEANIMAGRALLGVAAS